MRVTGILLTGLGLLGSSVALAFDPPPFPRLAVSWIDNQNYQDPAIRAQIAKTNVATINVWPGWESGRGTTVEQAIANMKAINPNLLVVNYVKNNEIDGTASNSVFKELFAKLDATRWYLYPQGTSGTPVPAVWPGATSINNTTFTGKDGNGDNWLSWSAKWFVQKYMAPSPSLDGFNVDNVFWRPRVNGDWNLDGVTDSTGSALAAQWHRQGYVSFFRTLRASSPGKFFIGNITDWGDPQSVLTEYQGLLDGGIMEALIGQDYSPETWADWNFMMAWYRKTMTALGGPKIGVFGQVGDPSDYQAFRYGFASCLMDDGYYQFNSKKASAAGADNGSLPWFDEYNYLGRLGAAVSGPSKAAWQNGVYRRDFANGIALVNPKGNGIRTVTLETGYRRLTGTQSPAVNNGQISNTVTLMDRDGIILLKIDAAKPAAPVNVKVE